MDDLERDEARRLRLDPMVAHNDSNHTTAFTVSVEARTFELGILRMVGMTRLRLVGLVLTQALSFSVPADLKTMIVPIFAGWSLFSSIVITPESAPIRTRKASRQSVTRL